MQDINTDIILEQIDMVIEKAIAENEAVLISLGIEERKIGEDGALDMTEEVENELTDRSFLQITN